MNSLDALSGASGVCLVRAPVPAPMGSGSSLALPGGLVMVAGVSQAARSDHDVGSESLSGMGVGSCKSGV